MFRIRFKGVVSQFRFKTRNFFFLAGSLGPTPESYAGDNEKLGGPTGWAFREFRLGGADACCMGRG